MTNRDDNESKPVEPAGDSSAEHQPSTSDKPQQSQDTDSKSQPGDGSSPSEDTGRQSSTLLGPGFAAADRSASSDDTDTDADEESPSGPGLRLPRPSADSGDGDRPKTSLSDRLKKLAKSSSSATSGSSSDKSTAEQTDTDQPTPPSDQEIDDPDESDEPADTDQPTEPAEQNGDDSDDPADTEQPVEDSDRKSGEFDEQPLPEDNIPAQQTDADTDDGEELAPTDRLDTLPFAVPDDFSFSDDAPDDDPDDSDVADTSPGTEFDVGAPPEDEPTPFGDVGEPVDSKLETPGPALRPFAPETLDDHEEPSQPGGKPAAQGLDDESDDPTADEFDEPNWDVSAGLAEDTDADSPPIPEHHRGSDPESSSPDDRRPDHAAPSSAGSTESTDTDGSGDFEARDTELFESPYENDPICPRLSVLEGPAVGQEFLVDQTRNSIGRGTSNSVVVPDRAMSRRHFEVIQHPDESYEIRDLMAVNGTTLNGVDVKEADLFHGDRIEAGQTVFQFLIPGDTPTSSGERRMIRAEATRTHAAAAPEQSETPDAEPASLFDKVLLGITIVAGLACIPLIAILVHAVVVDDPGPRPDVQASELYFQGVDALQNARWNRAEELFEESRDADPEFGEIDAQLARIDDERRAQQVIETARNNDDQGLNQEVVDQLRTISRHSHYYDEARTLLSRARQHEAQQLFHRARDAYDDEDYEQALRSVEELRAVAPRHEQADGLERDIRRALQPDDDNGDTDDTEPTSAPSPSPTASTATAPDSGGDSDDATLALDDPFADTSSGDTSTGGNSRPVGGINFTDGFSLYRSEKFDEAIDHFEAIADGFGGTVGERADRTAEDIRSFQQSLDRGRTALEQGRLTEALERFETAGRADAAVAGGGGWFETEVTDYIATTLAEQGRHKIDDEDFSSAFEVYQRARAHGEDHPDVRALGQALERQAQSLYIRAANQRKSDPDGAAELSRTVLTMVPRDSDIHQRVRRLLDELE